MSQLSGCAQRQWKYNKLDNVLDNSNPECGLRDNK